MHRYKNVCMYFLHDFTHIYTCMWMLCNYIYIYVCSITDKSECDSSVPLYLSFVLQNISIVFIHFTNTLSSSLVFIYYYEHWYNVT